MNHVPDRTAAGLRRWLLAAWLLQSLTITEGVMADPTMTRKTVEVEHITITSTTSFAAAKAALEGLLPTIDPGITVLLRYGESDRARKELERGPELAIFQTRDHGALLQISGRPRKAIQYDIGNPLTASKMTQQQLPAALYAPFRVVLYENEDGHATFEYDQPSSLFGQFGDERVTAVARGLDDAIARVLREAAK
jgi:uncharacterized protein (DUF302 family)